jgi:pyrimidine deaminase RibD-like protein
MSTASGTSLLSELRPVESYDREFMEMAVEAARKCVGEGKKPTPYVGAVAARDGQLLDVAYRGQIEPGQHAEYTLLEELLPNESLAGATVYVTLEPCTHRGEGKSPCANRLISRKVKKVFIGMLDPYPLIQGNGYFKLRDANIITQFFDHDLMSQLEELNREFSDYVRSDAEADAIQRGLGEIRAIAMRSKCPQQRRAIESAVEDALDATRLAQKNRFRILGADAGFFKNYLDILHARSEPEYVRVFVKTTSFHTADSFKKFALKRLYDELKTLAQSGKLLTDYIFLLRSRDCLQDDSVIAFLDRYKPFSREIRVVFADSTRVNHENIQRSIAVLENEKIAFTHDRDNDGRIVDPIEYRGSEDYNRLEMLYEEIAMDSHKYFSEADGDCLEWLLADVL